MTVHYATYSKALRTGLGMIDSWLAWRGTARRVSATLPASPARILVCNQAHLGDAVLATAILPALRFAHPQAEIGFLVHPQSRPAVQGHPQVRWVHTVEHWHLIRDPVSMWERIRRHRASRRAALRDIRAVGYDLAIDLHPYFPNSIPLLAKTGIGCLVGWSSAGFGRMLDRAASDDGGPINAMDRHARILHLLNISCEPSALRPTLHLSERGIEGWLQHSRRSDIREDFIAAHIGAHSAHRRWPASQWAEVLVDLGRHGHQIVLLGHGEDEVALGQAIATRCPLAIDLCGQLTWDELLAAVAACRLMLSHDSAAAHLAVAFDRPRICVATGIHDLRMWLRASGNSIVLSKSVPCAPCGRVAGCATMDCIRGVSGQAVIEATTALLESAGTSQHRPISEGGP